MPLLLLFIEQVKLNKKWTISKKDKAFRKYKNVNFFARFVCDPFFIRLTTIILATVYPQLQIGDKIVYVDSENFQQNETSKDTLTFNVTNFWNMKCPIKFLLEPLIYVFEEKQRSATGLSIITILEKNYVSDEKKIDHWVFSDLVKLFNSIFCFNWCL